jgi:hypothetical protein
LVSIYWAFIGALHVIFGCDSLFVLLGEEEEVLNAADKMLFLAGRGGQKLIG